MGLIINSALVSIILISLATCINGCPAATETCRGFLFSGVSMYRTVALFGGGCRDRCTSSVLTSLAEIGGWKCGRCPGTENVFIRDTAFLEMTLSPVDGILVGSVYNAWDNATKTHFVELNTDIEVLDIQIFDVNQLLGQNNNSKARRSFDRSLANTQVTIRSALSVLYKPKRKPNVKPPPPGSKPPIGIDKGNELNIRLRNNFTKKEGRALYIERLNFAYVEVAPTKPSLDIVDTEQLNATLFCPAVNPVPIRAPTPAPVRAPTLPVAPVKAPTLAPVRAPTPAPVPLHSIVINELMVNPEGADSRQEWFELYNAGAGPVNLTNWKITDNTRNNSIAIVSRLVVPAGEYIVVAPSANRSVNGGITPNITYSYGASVGQFQLLNSEDSVVLYNADDVLVDRMQYNESHPGVVTLGSSMQLRSPTLDNTNDASNWCFGNSLYGDSSTGNLGTPGRANVCEFPNIVINELMVNPEGADSRQEWFELYNAGTGPVDLNKWEITDDLKTNSIVIQSSLVVDAGEYVVVAPTFNTSNNGGIYVDITYSYGPGVGQFELTNSRDSVVLYNADNVLVDRIQYNESHPGVVTLGSSMQLMSSTLDNTNNASNWCFGSSLYGDASTGNLGTPGRANICEFPNIVINELMVNPAGAQNLQEWFELYNAGPGPVDLKNWLIMDEPQVNVLLIPFRFVLPAGDYVVMAPSSNTSTNGGISPDIRYNYGSGNGFFQLLNSVGSIELYNADAILVDRMRYDTSYPGVLSGTCTMQLRSPTLDNTNNVSNWCHGIPGYGDGTNFGTPGGPTVC